MMEEDAHGIGALLIKLVTPSLLLLPNIKDECKCTERIPFSEFTTDLLSISVMPTCGSTSPF